MLVHGAAAQHQVVSDQNPCDPFFLYTPIPRGQQHGQRVLASAGVQSARVFRILPRACSIASILLWFTLFDSSPEKPWERLRL